MKYLRIQPFTVIALFTLALLVSASQFAAATQSADDSATDKTAEPRNLMVVAKTHEQGVALREMLSNRSESTQLADLKGGFTIECSERFGNQCKIFGK